MKKKKKSQTKKYLGKLQRLYFVFRDFLCFGIKIINSYNYIAINIGMVNWNSDNYIAPLLFFAFIILPSIIIAACHLRRMTFTLARLMFPQYID